MAGMKNLIRIQKWKLDEQRRAISDMENLREGFKNQLAKLDRDQLLEQKVAADNLDASFAYANYLTMTKQRRLNLLDSVSDADQRIATAQEDVALVFQELKKFEISEERRMQLLKELQDKRLQEEMDEISIDMHRRKSL